jgi:putative colanic acid biosynthesis acetyltransferase WcaF
MSTSAQPIKTHAQATPYDSPWTFRQRVAAFIWEYVWVLLCVWTPKPLNPWRLFILRLFGAKLTGTPFVHQRARIQLPWNLTMHHRACLGDRANAYTLGPITIGEGATIAQEAYLCSGTHDFASPALPLQTSPIHIGAEVFVGARALILPGVTIGDRAIIGACSVVTKNVAPSAIVAGNPAKQIGTRPPSTS